MSRYIALGLDQQGRQLPTLLARQLTREDTAGVCNACPAEVDDGDAFYQAAPGERSYWTVIGVMAGVGLAAVVMVHLLGRTGSLP